MLARYYGRPHLNAIKHPELKPNGKPIFRSVDYQLKNYQQGWSLDLVKGGSNNCPFICSICRGLPKFPLEVKECGCAFCFDCINLAVNRVFKEFPMRDTAPCPNCKTTFCPEKMQLVEEKSRALYRLFTAIDVRCSYGCGATKGTKSLIEHEMYQCPKRPVNCPNGCTLNGEELTLPDSDMEAHLECCENRLVNCNKCRIPKPFAEKKHQCVKALSATIERMI